MNNIIDIDNLSICDFISELDNIGSEKDKTEFVKNYSQLKDKIANVDSILGKDNTIEFKDKNVTELFELLDQYNGKINNPIAISIEDLNIISNLIKLIEDKIEQEKLNIIEIK